MEMLGSIISSVRERTPLVHHITNYVTVNDCANITLCIGGSPVMAHAEEEVEEMVSMAGALVLNIGTLDTRQITRMFLAGKAAGKQGIPIILDPVGAGATGFRTKTAQRMIQELPISVLKGNAGEIGTLAGIQSEVRGVDSGGVMGDPVEITRMLAERLGSTVVMSGVIDVVSDGNCIIQCENGHPYMGRLSGTGCMAASIIGACAAVSSDYSRSSAAGITAFGIAGERAAAKAAGPGSFKYHLFDHLATVTEDDVNRYGRIRKL
ncbi:MAG: hydroxyethylthiazole kinase [Methanomicrobiales archaeon]|nr:hydroxyethylthiazole kinase [Methanomicrobiales archaeon]